MHIRKYILYKTYFFFNTKLNSFIRTDTTDEHVLIKKCASSSGAFATVVSHHWAKGGLGAFDLAQAVIDACNRKSEFKLLYELGLSIEDKINVIAKEMYGAGSIEFEPRVREIMKMYSEKVSIIYKYFSRIYSNILFIDRDLEIYHFVWQKLLYL